VVSARKLAAAILAATLPSRRRLPEPSSHHHRKPRRLVQVIPAGPVLAAPLRPLPHRRAPGWDTGMRSHPDLTVIDFLARRDRPFVTSVAREKAA
jgi:hypothetical protein